MYPLAELDSIFRGPLLHLVPTVSGSSLVGMVSLVGEKIFIEPFDPDRAAEPDPLQPPSIAPAAPIQLGGDMQEDVKVTALGPVEGHFRAGQMQREARRNDIAVRHSFGQRGCGRRRGLRSTVKWEMAVHSQLYSY